MVGMWILPNNMRFPLSECYWKMTIYSDTLHWWDITPIFDPLLIWALWPNLTFYLILWGFHRTFATGAACQQRTLTPPDTWSCPTLGLACVLMSRPISPELFLFPDLWVSNIPRYFFFAFHLPQHTCNQKDTHLNLFEYQIMAEVSFCIANVTDNGVRYRMHGNNNHKEHERFLHLPSRPSSSAGSVMMADHRDVEGNTALHLAVLNNQPKVNHLLSLAFYRCPKLSSPE